MRLKRGEALKSDIFFGTISFSWVFSKIWSINSESTEGTEGQPDPDAVFYGIIGWGAGCFRYLFIAHSKQSLWAFTTSSFWTVLIFYKSSYF